MGIVVAGIDVGKVALQVHATGDEHCVKNELVGFRALRKWLLK